MRINGQPPGDIDAAVGARIRTRRRIMGADQRELAAAVGVTFHQIRKYEDGENRISASMLVRIAAKLESTVAAFVGEDGPNPVKTAMHVQLAQPDTADLLTAFAEIPSSKARQALLRVVQAVVSD